MLMLQFTCEGLIAAAHGGARQLLPARFEYIRLVLVPTTDNNPSQVNHRLYITDVWVSLPLSRCLLNCSLHDCSFFSVDIIV